MSAERCGHPNHGAADHDCQPFRAAPEAEAGCRHAELPDALWTRLRAAEAAAARRLELLRAVVSFVDVNNGDLPLGLLDQLRTETQR
jgi:hypothetical protein